MNNPLVTIIVPIYNNEKYLKRCIDSIVNQDYQNLEIILVDDGSKDKTSVYCDEYTTKDKRIKVIHQTNKGLSAARNAGIKIATGNYIYLVDSDDWIATNAITVLVNLAHKTNADITLAKYVNVINGEYRYSNTIYNETYSAKQCQYEVNKCNINFITAWNKLYKRNIFDNTLYSEGFINEDEAIIHHIYGTNRKIAISNENLYFDFHHSKSIMYSSKPIQFFNGYYNAFYDRYNYYSTIDEYKPYRKYVLKRLNGCCVNYLKSKPNLTDIDKKKITQCIKLLIKHLDLRSIKLLYLFLTN